jgi:hypothetical protein
MMHLYIYYHGKVNEKMIILCVFFSFVKGPRMWLFRDIFPRTANPMVGTTCLQRNYRYTPLVQLGKLDGRDDGLNHSQISLWSKDLSHA